MYFTGPPFRSGAVPRIRPDDERGREESTGRLPIGPALRAGERSAEDVGGLRGVVGAVAVLGPQLVPGHRQAGWGAVQDVDRAGGRDRADVLDRHADRQILRRALAEAADGQRRAELVAVLRRTRDALGALIPELAAVAGDPGRASVQHVHDAGIDGAAGILPGDADHEVGLAGVPEVPHRDGESEEVVLLGGSGHTDTNK